MNKKSIIVAILILLSFSIVLAANFWVDINMNLKSIYNGTWANFTYHNGTYYGDGQYLTGVVGGDNSTTEIRAAVNDSSLYYDFKVNNSEKLDNLDSTHFYPENKTMSNATLFKDNVKAYFGDDLDFKIYYNGSHLYIGP